MAGLTNQQLLTRGDRKYAAKKKAAAVAAVEYDPDSRQEFLSGFHKRKVARQAEAKRRAEELNRQQRLVERRKLRESRREQIDRGMDRLKEAEQLIDGRRLESDDETLGEETTEPQTDDEDEFAGFRDSSGILKRRKVAYGDASVTIEEIPLDPYVDLSRSEEVLDESTRKANEYASYVHSLDAAAQQQAAAAQKLQETREQQRDRQAQRQKKKKFRYLPKSERKLMTKKRH